MKLSPSMKVTLAVIVAVVACGYLVAAYASAENQYLLGRDQVNSTKLLLARAVNDGQRTLEEIQAETVRAEERYRAVLESFPPEVTDAPAVESLLKIGDTYDLKVTGISKAESVKKVEAYEFPVSAYTVRLLGEYEQVLMFVMKLEGLRTPEELRSLPDLTVDHVRMRAVGGSFEAEVAISVFGRPSMSPASVTAHGQGTGR